MLYAHYSCFLPLTFFHFPHRPEANALIQVFQFRPTSAPETIPANWGTSQVRTLKPFQLQMNEQLMATLQTTHSERSSFCFSAFKCKQQMSRMWGWTHTHKYQKHPVQGTFTVDLYSRNQKASEEKPSKIRSALYLRLIIVN